MVQQVNIPAYGGLKIEGDHAGTIAYLNGDAPRVYIRDGSDSFALPVGQCVPLSKSWAEIVNPFPRAVSLTIGRGLPVQYQPEQSAITQQQAINSYSFSYVQRDVAVTGRKFAVGLMMKRGQAYIHAFERNADVYSKIMFFPGARPDFMAYKPGGAMTEEIPFYFSDGQRDKSMFVVGGTYTDADVTAWMAAAGYGLAPIVQRHASFNQSFTFYRATVDTAVFYVRDAAQGCHAMLRVQHLGADLEEFD